ncbi:MAG: O-antigen ligase family protein [Proteobacteria bacterium]|nr:O-antigen ligase family protein [Pseudomonadota bacterium]MBU1417872.1 O-antigen ligase family protein [Pseudomonadota bacterium]MBU1453394.1 O-antigen ligase family protein [Pseudomonadota bacterium]
MNSLAQKATAAASPLLVLFAFALPLSTSVTSILAILLILVWIAGGDLRKKLTDIFHNPLAIAVLVYIGLYALGLLWSKDLDWGIQVLLKQWKLLLFPVFLTLVNKDHTKYYLSAFVAAIVIQAGKAYLVWLGVIALSPGSTFTTEGTSHVVYNPMLALAIYIILQNILLGTNRALFKALKGFLFLFLFCNMFITVGRTGHVAFFVLLVVTLFQYFQTRSKKMLVMALILLPLLITAIYQISPTFRTRITTAVTEVQNFRSGEITSMGCRLWFCTNTLEILKKNWLTGTGTGDFPGEYAKINQSRSPAMPNTDNPHNQYLLVTALFGIFGLLSLLAIFSSQLVLAVTMKDSLTPLRLAFPIFFLVIMLSESYLQVYETGFLFSFFSSFLYNCSEEWQQLSPRPIAVPA